MVLLNIRKNTISSFAKISILLLFWLASVSTYAQKLPKIQEASLRIPSNAKIDGKSSEWSNKFQAFNNVSQVFYTIANDDDRLYLILKAPDQLVIRKIIAGGVTITVRLSDDKKDKGVAITYPLFNKNNWPVLNLIDKPIVTKDSTINSKTIDSFVYSVNRSFQSKSKEIGVFGVKDIDSTISIYNEDGIKAVSLFDHNVSYTYELVVPLKYLGLSIDNITTFRYDIRLNSPTFIEGATVTEIEGGTLFTGNDNIPISDLRNIRASTYFSGSYTLAKK